MRGREKEGGGHNKKDIVIFIPGKKQRNKHRYRNVSYLRHLFEYIGTQFPPLSSLLYGKMGSITLFFFQMGILNMIQHFMHKY